MPDAFGAGTAPNVPNAIVQNDKPICGVTHLVRCVQDLGENDKGIFTSPLHLQPKDVYWLAPLGAASDSIAKLFAAHLRRTEESALGGLLVEITILHAATRQNAAQVLRDAATAYKVDTDVISPKVKQEFATK